MGWTYAFQRPADPKAVLNGLLTWSDARGRRRVLDSAIVRLRGYYAAVEHIDPDGARQVWAAGFLVDFRRGADGLAFGYKDMTEHMGPVESECPERILRRLGGRRPAGQQLVGLVDRMAEELGQGQTDEGRTDRASDGQRRKAAIAQGETDDPAQDPGRRRHVDRRRILRRTPQGGA